MRVIGVLSMVVLAAAVPVLLISSSARIVIYSGWIYNYGFEKYGVAGSTGIAQPELLRVADEITEYFSNDRQFLEVHVTMGVVRRPLFNAREVQHMVDVKRLVQGLPVLQGLSLAVVGALMAVALWNKGQTLRRWVVGVLGGCIAAVTIILVAALGSLVAFGPLFTLFHQLGFSNDLWLLDPKTDYLLKLFPQGFFLDATLAIAAVALGAGLIGAGAMWGVLRVGRKAFSTL